MKSVLFAVSVAFLSLTFQKDKPAYQLFTKSGKKVIYAKMLDELSKADVILFGEYHNNPISHWLQLEVTKDLFKKRKIILGAEMFEADNQKQLNSLLQPNAELDTAGLRLWPNYHTDYAPLVHFARDNQLEFIATNVPRRYANRVYKKGFEALDSISIEEKEWIVPMPFPYDPNLPSYQAMLEMMGGHGGENFPKAQAIKDATMAFFIQKNRKNKLFIHYNGSYHSDDFEGIGWYLRKQNPELKICTIATVSKEKLNSLSKDEKNKADYIIAVSETMTTTH